MDVNVVEGFVMLCSVSDGVYLGGVDVGDLGGWKGWRRCSCVWECGLYEGDDDGFLGLEIEKYHLFM